MWLVILLCVVAILVLLFLMLHIKAPQTTSLIQSSPTPTRPQHHIAIPFHLDRNGLPLLDLYVGTPPQRVEVAIDTGSSDLVVGGSACRACEAKFHPERSSTGREQGGGCLTVTYGTQQDVGCWFQDTIELRGFEFDGTYESLEKGAQSGRTTVRKTVSFILTNKREGSPYGGDHPTSDYSILGMAATPESESPFIQQLLPQGSHTFTIINKRGAHWLVLSEPTCFDLLPIPSTPYHGHYTGRVAAIKWGALRDTRFHTLVFDSGSNMVFIPDQLWTPEMTQAQEQEQDFAVQFAGKASLVIPGKHLRNYVMPYQSNEGVIVLGTLILMDMAIQFDVARHQVAVAYT